MLRQLLARVTTGLLGAVLLTAPVAALAQASDGDGDGVPDASDACPKEAGVKSSDPKTSGCAARMDAGKIKDRSEITFTGYRVLPGNRGIVFVELTDAVAVEVSRSGQVIEYKLLGATVPLKNNKNALLMGDFNGSALSARLVTDKPVRHKGAPRHAKPTASARLVITLRGDVSPTYRMLPRTKGAVLEVELPPMPAR